MKTPPGKSEELVQPRNLRGDGGPDVPDTQIEVPWVFVGDVPQAVCRKSPDGSGSKSVQSLDGIFMKLVGGLEHEFYFSIYWESSSHLTNIYIYFQRGRSTTTTRNVHC